MVICYHCKQENHEKCISTSSSIMGRCPCEVRKHALKTYVIQTTFEVHEFSPSDAKSVLSDLLAQNSKLPTPTNMKIVFPVERDLCICGHFYDNHKSAIGGGTRICTICPCLFYDDVPK